MINPGSKSVVETVAPRVGTEHQFTVLPEVADNVAEIVDGAPAQILAAPTEPAKKWENPVFSKAAVHGSNFAGFYLLATNSANFIAKTATASGVWANPNTPLPFGELWRFATTNYNAFQYTVGEVARNEGSINVGMFAAGVAAIGLSTVIRSWRKQKAKKAKQQEVLPPELVAEEDKSTLR